MAQAKILRTIAIVLNLSEKEAIFLRDVCQNSILDDDDDDDHDIRQCRQGIVTVLSIALSDVNKTSYINGPRD